MTQRVFDIENEKDVRDLWSILPECIEKIKKNKGYNTYSSSHIDDFYETAMLKINWHDKTEITRPIQEATEADLGKLCCFGDVKPNEMLVGLLACVDRESICNKYMLRGGTWYAHCRRLTKQEIEELC